MKNRILSLWEKVIKIPWRERSILMSEAFAFCTLGDLFDIDVILESGIYLGRSTEIWASYFSNKPIYAIDRELKGKTVKLLKKHINVTLIKGNGFELLKQLSIKFISQKIGIFMDGPKGCKALQFGFDALRQQNIKFFALHDVYKIKNGKQNKVRESFEILKSSTFFTDEQWFIDKYSELDKNESNWDSIQNLKWVPNKYLSKDDKHDRILGSYGPTIGFAFNLKELKGR